MDTMKDTTMQPATDAVIEELRKMQPIAWVYEDMLGRKCVGFERPLHRRNTHEPLFSAATHAVVMGLVNRLEAAEKTRDKLKELNIALCTKSNSQVIHNARLAEENDALRAKIETAENDAAHQKALAASALRVAEGWERKCGELRAKVAEMGQQEPVGVLHVGSYYGEELQDWEFEANQCACDKLNEAYVRNPMSLPLYALPGAKGEEK